MTFEQFVTHAVRNRPEEEQWQLQVCYALLGLAGETAQLLDFSRQWSANSYYASTTNLVRRLGPFEFYRALAYYQLDKRPGLLIPSDDEFARLYEFAEGMAVQAGVLNIQVRDWLFHRRMLDERVDEALRRFEVARHGFYRLLQLDPQDVWQLLVAGLPNQHFVPTPSPQQGLEGGARSSLVVIPFLGEVSHSRQ